MVIYDPVELVELSHEERIVWLQHPECFVYLRETRMLVPGRRRRPGRYRVPAGIVAFAVLAPDAPAAHPGMFWRRVWWLASHDPYADGGWPTEAVHPCSVRPGRPSREPFVQRDLREAR